MLKLLTIVIPTHNRCAYIRQLVPALCADLSECRELVHIIVSDNASTDETAVVMRDLQAGGLDFEFIQRPVNIGMDGNFSAAITHVTSRYCWLLGDDDVPVRGTLARVVEALVRVQPDLLYLRSAWFPNAFEGCIGTPNLTIPTKPINNVEFSLQVNYWVTFISSMVFDLAHYRRIAPAGPPDEFRGTTLIHLHWVLQLIKYGKKFLVSNGAVIKATGNNSGGYSLTRVFGVNFPRLLDLSMGPASRLGRIIKRSNTLSNLPRLLYTVRFAHIGDFELESLPAEILAEHRDSRLTASMYNVIMHRGRRAANLARLTLQVIGRCEAMAKGLSASIRSMWLCAGRITEGVARRGLLAAARVRGMFWTLRTTSAGDQSAYIGPGGQFRGLRFVRMHGKLVVGRRCRIELYDRFANQQFEPLLWLGANVSMENDCHIGVIDRVELHDGVMLASRVYISDHAHGALMGSDRAIPPFRRPLHSKGPVVIERNVWIGEGVTILPGVRIGEGAIVGANSVVTRDVPAMSIVVGSPARPITR